MEVKKVVKDKEVLETLRVFVPISLVRRFAVKTREKPEKYAELDKKIKSARLPVTLQRYLAIASFYSNLSFIFGTVILLLLIYYLKVNVPLFIYRLGELILLTLSNTLGKSAILTKLKYYLIIITIGRYSTHFTIALALLFGIIFKFLTRKIILSYPRLLVKNRVYEIDLFLPHAVNMMYGMAIGGSPAYEIIKKVAEARTLFGELSKEFGIIVEMVEIFKKDLLTAIRYVRDTTPSAKLASFLDNLIFILRGGGKLSDFLKSKSEEYLEEQEISFESYISTMGMLSEIYLALFVMMPLFVLITLVVMGITGQNVLIPYRNALILLLPPLAGLMVFLIKSVVGFPAVKLEKFEEKFGSPKVNLIKTIAGTFRIGKFRMLVKRVKRFLLHPFRTPIYSLHVRIVMFHTAVIALIVFIILIRFIKIETATVVALSVFLVPLIILSELRERAIRNIEKNLPDVFSELAMLNEAGLTVQEGLRVLASTTEIGILTREINILEREIRWGILIPSAFIRLGLRIKSELLARIVPVIVRTLQTAATVKDAFFTVAKYAEAEIRFKDRLRKNMLVYVIIVYMCIAVFLFTSYVVINNFLSIAAHMKAVASQTIGTVKVYINIDFIKRIFLEVALIVAVISGLVAGVIENGKLSSGLKHVYAFVMMTYIVFFHILTM